MWTLLPPDQLSDNKAPEDDFFVARARFASIYGAPRIKKRGGECNSRHAFHWNVQWAWEVSCFTASIEDKVEWKLRINFIRSCVIIIKIRMHSYTSEDAAHAAKRESGFLFVFCFAFTWLHEDDEEEEEDDHIKPEEGRIGSCWPWCVLHFAILLLKPTITTSENVFKRMCKQ